MLAQPRRIRRDQSLRVHQEAARARLGHGQSLARHLQAAQVGDADGRAAGAVEHDAVIAQPVATDAARAQHARHGHRRGALDVVVEAAHAIAVALQQRNGRLVGEVLELDAAAREHLLHRHHEFLHEGVVLGAGDAALPQAGVQRILQESLVVGAHVQRHGQRGLGRHATERRVQRQLADGNAHAAHALITQTQDAFAIGHHDEAHVILGPVLQHLADAALAVQAHIQAARPAHDVSELLARLAHGGRVHQRHQARRIAAQHGEEQALVVVGQFAEVDVLVQIGGALLHLALHAQQLVGRRAHAVGQQAHQPKRLALVLGEGGSLVQTCVQEDVATVRHRGSLIRRALTRPWSRDPTRCASTHP